MVRFALKTLLADRGKLLTALVGVIFSLVLVNVQGGLFLGLIRKSSLIVDNCEADIWVGHRGLENADFAEDIPEVWLNRIRGLPEIDKADPFICEPGIMSLPNGGYQDVWIIGCDESSLMGGPWSFSEGGLADLRRPNGITIERVERWKLGFPEVGDVVEISNARAKVVAITEGIVGFLHNPYVFTTIDSARSYTRIRDGFCSYFLIKVREGADVQALAERIREMLPDTDVYTSSELAWISHNYWMIRTGIGISFGTATILGLLVGLVMVAQSLYALALDHLHDFATLKAIGAEDGHVYQILITQALIIAVVGIILGVGVVSFLKTVASSPYAPIIIPGWLQGAGIAMVMGICLFACVLPFRRIRSADPATALQG